MSHPHHQPWDRDTQPVKASSPSIDGTVTPSPLPNVLTGVVSSRREGLTRTTYRIRIGERTDVCMRWPRSMPSRRTLEIGQTVRLTIPQDAVHLEAGGFRRGRQRWNRWIGRVVLPSHRGETGSTTVKVHQDPITLKSRGPVIGAHERLSTWDTVNIVVDPQQIKVCSCALASVQEPQHRRPSPATVSLQTTSVWLPATLQACRPIPSGQLLALNVGGATLSALIETEQALLWGVGDAVEINIGSGDTCIRKDAHSPMLSCCIVLSTEFADAPLSGSIRRHDQ